MKYITYLALIGVAMAQFDVEPVVVNDEAETAGEGASEEPATAPADEPFVPPELADQETTPAEDTSPAEEPAAEEEPAIPEEEPASDSGFVPPELAD